MAALPLKLWWINLSAGKKTAIVLLFAFLVIIVTLASAIPVTLAVIEEIKTHHPVPGRMSPRTKGRPPR